MSIKNELKKSVPATVKLTEEEKATIRYRVRQSHSPEIHLKPMVISILSVMILGILVLPTIQPIEKEENTSNQITLNNTDDSSISITEEQKQLYYEQYLKIVEQAMKKKVGIAVSVSPMDEFKESDWVEPKEYEKWIQSMVDGHLATEREKVSAMSTTSNPAVTNIDGETTKITYIYFSDILKTIEVTGSFDTQYSSHHDRQLFVSVDNISTRFAYNPGTWEQTSYKASLIDGGRKYSIRIEGIFELNNVSIEKAFTIEFGCDEYGGIY